jgi:hypothetical protein
MAEALKRARDSFIALKSMGRWTGPGRALDPFLLKFFVEAFVHKDKVLSLIVEMRLDPIEEQGQRPHPSVLASTSLHRMCISCLAISD